MKHKSTNQKQKVAKTITFLWIILLLGYLKGSAQPGAALKFDGNGDAVNLGSAITTSLNGSTKITIEAWVNSATNSGGHGPIIGNYSTNNGGAFSFLLRRENNHHVFWIGNNTNQFSLVSLNTSSVNVWRHVACVWNGTVASIYVNGTLTATNAFSLTTLQNNTNDEVHIGAAPFTSEYFNGMIDEVRIWNVARTQCEINTFKNCEIPNNTPGLLANYHFNQGIANGSNTAVTTLTDATSSAITGTLAGITLTGTTSNWVAPGGVVSGSTTPLSGPSYSATSLSVCSGNTIMLTSTGATSFTWSPAITNATAFIPATSTGYTITNINGTTSCSNTAVANVTVNPKPTMSITTSNTLICSGQSATLVASGAPTLLWSNGGNVNVMPVSPTVTTSYTVTGTGANGCTNTATITQNVSPCAGIAESSDTKIAASIFPNPGSGNLTAKTDEAIETISIYNSLGTLVQTENTSSFSVASLVSGLYIVNIKTEKGTATIRFIRE